MKPEASIESPRFLAAIVFVLKWETVFDRRGNAIAEHDPDDPGGLTKFGIDQRCLDPETLILYSDLAWHPVGDAKVGDELLAFDENAEHCGKGRFRSFRRSIITRCGPLRLPKCRITFSDGTAVTCSLDHQFLAMRGAHRRFDWRTAGTLLEREKGQHSDMKVYLQFLWNPWREVESWEAGYLAGVLDGEGHFCHHVGFTQNPNKLSALACDIARSLGYSVRCRKSSGGFLGDRSKAYSFYMSGDEPYAYLKLLGQLRPPRLLEKAIKFTIDRRIRSQKARFKEVQSVERIGIGDVIGLETTTKTLFASGLYSHNSHPHLNIANLTKADAIGVYHRDYWLPVRSHELPVPVGEVVFDIAVNNGKARAAKWLQEALGVTADGFIGPQTLAAAEKANPQALAAKLLARRAGFYRSIARGGRAKFLKGWLNRNDALRKFAGL